MSASSEPLSIEHARNEFSESKRWWTRALIGQLALVIIAAVSALLPIPSVGVMIGVLALLGTGLLFLCKKLADDAYERAEAIRRRSLLRDGLARGPDAVDVARLGAETTRRPSSDPPPEGDYYNCSLPSGPRRLAHCIWESAHFTGAQAKRAAEHYGRATIVGTCVVLVAFYLVLSSGALAAPTDGTWVAQNGSRVAAAGITLLAFFGLGTLADLWRNFRSLAVVAEQTCVRCSALVAKPATRLVDVLPVLEDYNCAVARAAPLPSYIWRSLQKPLSQTWEVARAQVK